MKTAEEWNQLWKDEFNEPHGYAFQDFIEQVQLDAIKHGMTLAAKIAEDESDKVCHEDPFAHHAIITIRNNLKEIPK